MVVSAFDAASGMIVNFRPRSKLAFDKMLRPTC